MQPPVTPGNGPPAVCAGSNLTAFRTLFRDDYEGIDSDTFRGFEKNNPLRKACIDSKNAIKRELKVLGTQHRKKTLLNAKCLQPYDLASDPSPSKPVTTDMETISSVLNSTPPTQVKRRGRPPRNRKPTETESMEVPEDDQEEEGATFEGFEKDSDLLKTCKKNLQMIQSELGEETSFRGFEPDDPFRAECEKHLMEIKKYFKSVTQQEMLY